MQTTNSSRDEPVSQALTHQLMRIILKRPMYHTIQDTIPHLNTWGEQSKRGSSPFRAPGYR